MLSAPQPGERGLGRESRLAKGPGWEIFPCGSFSVGSELSREEPRESVAVWGALNSAERQDRPNRPLAAAVAVFSSFPMGIWLPAWGCRDPINETQEQRPATCGNPGAAGQSQAGRRCRCGPGNGETLLDTGKTSWRWSRANWSLQALGNAVPKLGNAVPKLSLLLGGWLSSRLCGEPAGVPSSK